MVLHFASRAKTGFHCVEIFSNDVKIIYLKIKLCVYANWQIFFLKPPGPHSPGLDLPAHLLRKVVPLTTTRHFYVNIFNPKAKEMNSYLNT